MEDARITRRAGALLLPVLMIVSVAVLGPVAVVAAPPADLVLEQVLFVDSVGERPGVTPAADLLSVGLYRSEADGGLLLRISFLSLDVDAPGAMGEAFAADRRAEIPVTVSGGYTGQATSQVAAFALGRSDRNYRLQDSVRGAPVLTYPGDVDAVYIVLDLDPVSTATKDNRWNLLVETGGGAGGQILDEISASYPPARDYEAHCAFVLHGNQGIGYTDVFHGRYDDPEGSGFDEALQVHENLSVPGNFHLSGTLQSAAEWQARNGDPIDFNQWLHDGVTQGWAGMITSAYGQHMMPFVTNEMNDWSVEIQAQMTQERYNYFPTVAWVPERVWLNTSGYPSNGVNDWIGDNWLNHGIQGVILDDDVHLTSHDNHRIHTLTNNGLRLIPRDRSFTGNIIGGNGQAALDILTGLAGGGLGQYRIAVFAEDWEAAAEMGGWAGIVPNATETYDWIIGKCHDESDWLHTWKLADALANPDFGGDTMVLTPGTYHEIGGFDGYGGGNNGWYTHWAGWIPGVTGGNGSGGCGGAGGNCKDYGTLWNDAYNALMAAPDNNISQAGWYVLMTNLHETAWHDGMGGDISGWQHKYSAHIKNAMIYAEASHWADGEYPETTNLYVQDIDNDGHFETVMHNDHLFGVFEGTGGRLTHLFTKGDGYEDTVIGVDNAYWADTDGDYNDVNHVGAFSEVSPNYQHSGYLGVLSSDPGVVTLTMQHNEVTKEITLAEGDHHFEVVYRVGSSTHWIQSGFSPSLVDLVWNCELERIWPADQSYMGQRNPNTGVAAAWILGEGGASHQRDFSGTLMKGDEIKGAGVFQCLLYAGPTSAPDGSGDIAELRALADNVTDTLGPQVVSAQYYPASDRLRVTFDQAIHGFDASGFTVVDGPDGVVTVTLPAGTPVVETGPALSLTFELDADTAQAIEAMSSEFQFMIVAYGAATDEAGNGNEAVTIGDDLVLEMILTAVTIDGHLEPGEWDDLSLLDPGDSQWTSSNEIDALHVSWDETYLYVAIDGRVEGNSWLLYLDVDPGSGNGETDLTGIDAWERGASFTAAGFDADFQYGCYQHQSPWDGDGFWQLTSATTTTDRSGEISSAFDSFHAFGDAGGSELAIPWNTLYGLGAGAVPPGAEVSLVASICWDPEPDGELGGDSVPSNTAAVLPVIDNVWTVIVDANGDGVPDGSPVAATPEVPLTVARLLPNVPNPFNPSTMIRFEVPGPVASEASLAIYDLRGRRITDLARGVFAPGRHEVLWTGRSDAGLPVAAGTYFCRFQCGGQVVTRPLSLVK